MPSEREVEEALAQGKELLEELRSAGGTGAVLESTMRAMQTAVSESRALLAAGKEVEALAAAKRAESLMLDATRLQQASQRELEVARALGTLEVPTTMGVEEQRTLVEQVSREAAQEAMATRQAMTEAVAPPTGSAAELAAALRGAPAPPVGVVLPPPPQYRYTGLLGLVGRGARRVRRAIGIKEPILPPPIEMPPPPPVRIPIGGVLKTPWGEYRLETALGNPYYGQELARRIDAAEARVLIGQVQVSIAQAAALAVRRGAEAAGATPARVDDVGRQVIQVIERATPHAEQLQQALNMQQRGGVYVPQALPGPPDYRGMLQLAKEEGNEPLTRYLTDVVVGNLPPPHEAEPGSNWRLVKWAVVGGVGFTLVIYEVVAKPAAMAITPHYESGRSAAMAQGMAAREGDVEMSQKMGGEIRKQADLLASWRAWTLLIPVWAQWAGVEEFLKLNGEISTWNVELAKKRAEQAGRSPSAEHVPYGAPQAPPVRLSDDEYRNLSKTQKALWAKLGEDDRRQFLAKLRAAAPTPAPQETPTAAAPQGPEVPAEEPPK